VKQITDSTGPESIPFRQEMIHLRSKSLMLRHELFFSSSVFKFSCHDSTMVGQASTIL